MDDNTRSEILANIVQLISKSRTLMRQGHIASAEKAAREAIKLRAQLAEAQPK
jgi:hypothetical protein